MIRMLKYVVLVLLSLVSVAAYSYSNIAHAMLIGTSNFIELKQNTYVSDSLSAQDRRETLAMLDRARKRINQFYGEVSANPIIIITGNGSESNKYGIGDSPGALFITPWQKYLVLNNKKKSIDVFAHELVHAEIAEYLGYFKRQQQIPTWFDEGAAMQVDYRPEYDVNDLDEDEIANVKALTSPSKFWSDDKEQNITNYRASKAAVASIFKTSSPRSLYLILDKISNGGGL